MRSRGMPGMLPGCVGDILGRPWALRDGPGASRDRFSVDFGSPGDPARSDSAPALASPHRLGHIALVASHRIAFVASTCLHHPG